MAEPLPPLLPLHAFSVAATCGSFQSAAAQLGLTPSAVSHRIRQLEAWAGAPLFTRAPRKVVLTREGRLFAKAATRAFASLSVAGSASGSMKLEHCASARCRSSMRRS